MPRNKWDADPEKYARLSTPFESREEAKRATDGFIDELARLREKYHIAELTCQVMVYIKTEEDGIETMIGGAGWGNQVKQAMLAKRMADREVNSALDMIANLMLNATVLAEQLITDPRSSRDPLEEVKREAGPEVHSEG